MAHSFKGIYFDALDLQFFVKFYMTTNLNVNTVAEQGV